MRTPRTNSALARRTALGTLLLAPLLAQHQALAGTDLEFTTEYGIEFSTISDPGNRPTEPHELEIFFDLRIGAVESTYRISRKEITVGQWIEFVAAYLPFNEGGLVDPALTGDAISIFSGEPTVEPGHSLNEPACMAFVYAARYVNWLHNGKTISPEAFDTGVYRISRAGQDYVVSERSLTARFWIPSDDEWVKATYWDPDLDKGLGGYWYAPYNSNQIPVPSGLPGDSGAQTNAAPGLPLTDVMSYPDAQSPWGLFDVSGGMREYTESIANQVLRTRWIRGTQAGVGDGFFDRLDVRSQGINILPRAGLRIAAPQQGFCPGDCDLSGQVEFDDLISMLAFFGQPTDDNCDTDRSGTIGFPDLVAALVEFGSCD